jgi:hypothetical protein
VRVLSSLLSPTLIDPLACYQLLDPATVFDAFTTHRLAGARPYLDRALAVVAYPRQPLMQPPQPGDLLVRRGLGEPGLGHVAFIVGQDAYPPDQARSRDLRLEGDRLGFYLTKLPVGWTGVEDAKG